MHHIHRGGQIIILWIIKHLVLQQQFWLFQAAKSAVVHSKEFKALHLYYTTRANNPLKKMQSLIVVACKILRVIFTILKKGIAYDPNKMTMDIVRNGQTVEQAA